MEKFDAYHSQGLKPLPGLNDGFGAWLCRYIYITFYCSVWGKQLQQ